MHTRPLVACAVAFSLAASLAACSATTSDDASPDPTTATTKPVERNILSGRPGPNGPVLVVKIDDTSTAHPQIGLEDADVVYVEQVEAGLTRLAAVYSSSLPGRIGPVRSARISDINILANYGKVAFAYSGAQSRFLPVIASANLIDLGAQRQSPTIYTRDSSRRAPWNMVLLPQSLLDKAAERGLIPVMPKSVGWTFGQAPEGGMQIQSVLVSWPGSRYEITWNGKSFEMVQDGRAEVSDSGAPYAPSTIVIQLVKIAPSIYKDRHGGVTPESEVIGQGQAIVLRDGKAFLTRWSRDSQTAPTQFALRDGSPMPFSPGQVWVMLADQSRWPLINPAGPPLTQPAPTGGTTPSP